MKIAIVTPTISRAGGGIFPIVNAHARELSARSDMNVTVYGLDDDPNRTDRSAWKSLDLRTYSPRLYGMSHRLWRDLSTSKADVIHQHGLWMFPSLAVTAVRRRRRLPVVISVQGMLEPWALNNSNLKKRIASTVFERANLSGASAIHCSPAEVQGVRSYGLTGDVAVIPNGVDLPELGSASRPYFMPKNKRTLLFLGRLHPKKGISELLQAFAKMREIAPDISALWQVAIAGWDDGGHLGDLKNQADVLGLSQYVVFPGALFAEDKRAALLNADAFVLPSYSEGFPMAVLEAWAHALPVLMTRECNIPEGFEAGAAIEIKTDPEALARTLALALADPRLPDMGRRGRKLASERYAWPNVAQDLTSLYQWIAGRRVQPDFVISD